MYQDLVGKVAVVTGSSSGLGAAIVRRYLSEGMKVVINYFSDSHIQQAQEIMAEYNRDNKKVAVAIQADVSTEEGIEKLFQAAITEFGELDIWVNNAGMEIKSPTHEVSLEDWRKQLDINLTGVFLGAKRVIQYFLEEEKHGNIINISSVHEEIPWPTFAAYSASKGGVKLLTQTIASEYADKKIRANSIAPGAIATPINAEKFKDEQERAETEEMIPMDFIGEPEHVASCAAWLASTESMYVTGTTLFVDGGMTLYPSFQEGKG
ncbi:glucose 1-dehydrogenase [Vagococcus entomophilus]|uniref:Sugar dehydrogenase n=1 Tax=Vagococcus entomophilus TaxID=1160095 RepID=A0A430AGZ8_9ENTE|nr:glucose 1-dehydrogenase [Vagococcus entomophilus]RSU07216.1 sugar dehydrogenase [Vagococcus entomophilus]